MKATETLHERGPEPLARQHHPQHARRRHHPALHRRLLGHRADLQPVHLRQGDRVGRLRRRHREPRRARAARGEDLFFELAIDDLRRAADLFAAHPRAHRRGRRLGLARGLPAARLRHGGDGGGGQRCTPGPGAPTSSSRSPAPPRACRRSRSRSPPAIPINVTLLFSRRPLPGRRRRLHRRAWSAGSTTGSTPRSARWPRSSCPAGTSPWPKQVPAELKDRLGLAVGLDAYRAYRELHELRPLCSGWRTRGPACSGCSGRAPGPRTPTPPTPSTSTAWPRPSPSTRCRTKTLEAFSDHGEVGELMPGRRRRRRRRSWPGSPRPGSTSRRWPPSCSSDGAKAFVDSWNELMDRIEAQTPRSR